MSESPSFRGQAACQHDDRTGGNDYLLCNTCGLMWDYQREGPTDALLRNALAEIDRLTAEVVHLKDTRNMAAAGRVLR